LKKVYDPRKYNLKLRIAINKTRMYSCYHFYLIYRDSFAKKQYKLYEDVNKTTDHIHIS